LVASMAKTQRVSKKAAGCAATISWRLKRWARIMPLVYLEERSASNACVAIHALCRKYLAVQLLSS